MKKTLMLMLMLLFIAMPAMAAEVNFSIYEIHEGFNEFASITLTPQPFDIKKMKSVTLNLTNGYKGKIGDLEVGEYSLSVTIVNRDGHESGNWEVRGLPLTIKVSQDDEVILREVPVRKNMRNNASDSGNANVEVDYPFETTEGDDGYILITSAPPDVSIPLTLDGRPAKVSSEPVIIVPKTSSDEQESGDIQDSGLWKIFLGLGFFLVVFAIVLIWRKIMLWRGGGFKD